MSERKGGAERIIGNAYKIVKPLFQVRSYLYAQRKSFPPQCAASATTTKW